MDGNPAAGPGVDRRGSRRGAPRRVAPLPRRGARARRRDRLDPLARADLRRARGLALARRGGAARVRGGDRRAQRARAVSPQALVHVVATRQRRLPRAGATCSTTCARSAESLAANGGRRVGDGRVARLERMVEIFGFHIAKLDLRLHARDLGGATRARRRSRGGLAGRAQARPRGARHADRLGHVERGRRARRSEAQQTSRSRSCRCSRRSTTSRRRPPSWTSCSQQRPRPPPR